MRFLTNCYRVLLVLILAIFAPALTHAQKNGGDGADSGFGIFSSQQEYGEFMGAAKAAARDNPEMRAMIPMLNDIALGKPAGWTAQEYNVTDSTMGWLANENIRADLEMLDDQYEELQELNNSVRKRAGEQLRGLDFTDSANLMKQIQAIRASATDDINAVLLPHQLERLRQIQMQSRLRRQSLVDILTSNPVKGELKVTDAQSKELRAEEKRLQEEMEAEIARLRKEARERILSKLDSEQKAEVEKMLGDEFKFAEREKTKSRKDRGKKMGKKRK